VLFFYFNANFEDIRPIQVMEALLKQLSTIRLSTDNSIKVLEDHRKRGTRPTQEELMSALRHEISTYKNVYIVCDALDEFAEDNRHEFVDMLRSFPNSAHILITSRDIPSISALFPDDDRLQILADDGDMRTYIENELSKPGMLNRQVNMHPPIIQEVIAGVIEKACGM
jgi:hypothetical protein